MAHYTFEYPQQYKGYWWAKYYAEYIHVKEGWPNTGVILRSADLLESPPRRTTIDIYIGPKPSSYSNAEEAAKKSLRLVRENDPYFQIIEESPVTISGQEAYKLSYYRTLVTWGIPHPKGVVLYDKPPLIDFTRDVSFITDNLLWEISVSTAAEPADAAKDEFDHILETFKILK